MNGDPVLCKQGCCEISLKEHQLNSCFTNYDFNKLCYYFMQQNPSDNKSQVPQCTSFLKQLIEIKLSGMYRSL
jgi:hypothetical protein